MALGGVEGFGHEVGFVVEADQVAEFVDGGTQDVVGCDPALRGGLGLVRMKEGSTIGVVLLL